jgi:hypothetical protein
MGIGWMCIVAAEMIGGVGGGIGFYINLQANLGLYSNMFAGMIVIAILGLATPASCNTLRTSPTAGWGYDDTGDQGPDESFPKKKGEMVAIADFDLDVEEGEFVCILGRLAAARPPY